MSVESVKKQVEENGYEVDIIEFENSTATVELAADALNTRPENIAKSLAIRLKERDILVLCSGTRKLDNKKFKSEFNQKAKFISGDDLFEATGHPIGGVTPFGLSKDLDIYLDISLKELDVVYPAGGSSKTCIKINMDYLMDIFGENFVDVTV